MLTPDWSDAVFCLRERAGAYNKSFVVYPTGRPKGGSPGMPPSIDWEFVMSVFKIRKKFANFTKFWKFVKIRINSFYNINSNCNVFEFAQQLQLRLHCMGQPLNGNRWAVEDSDSDTAMGQTVKLQVIRRLCNMLLVIMLNYWRVNESWTSFIHSFIFV